MTLLLCEATNPGLLNGVQREDSYLGLEWPPKDISLSRSLYEAVENLLRMRCHQSICGCVNTVRKLTRKEGKFLYGVICGEYGLFIEC